MQDMEVLGEYTYDANGQRLSKTVNNQTDTYYYDGINLLYVTGDHWGDEIFLQNPGGDVIMSLRGAERYPYLTDIRGSFTNMLFENEDSATTYSYDAYGNTTISNPYYKSLLAYTGAVIDDETGLYYMNARYYDPATARFISEDPVRDGSSWYMYCAGDPVNFTDPSGCIRIGFKFSATKGSTSRDYFKVAVSDWMTVKNGGSIARTDLKCINNSISISKRRCYSAGSYNKHRCNVFNNFIEKHNIYYPY